ncbi:MAG: MCE family protein [Planctomycetes bacterium]|nr:MCE family protein [Planctomycetota bacterium]
MAKRESTKARGHEGEDLPRAAVRPERRLSAAWLIPLAALVLAGWLGLSAWWQRGVVITVQLPAGHGLKIGDPVRYRGITVGEVRDLRLARNLDHVTVTVGLQKDADALARAGSRFWVVRPRLRLTQVEGLETLLGPRYLAVVPPAPGSAGDAAPRRQRDFVGLTEPPVVQRIEPGDLEIVLEAPRRGSLSPGAAVTYRQLHIGHVLSVGLASDGGAIEARVHVRKAFRQLIRQNSRFWDSGGVRTDLSLTGLTLELDSLEALLAGSVAVATPPPDEAGGHVLTGHRFSLAEKADDEWLEWAPQIAVGSSLLPPGAMLPQPLRATIRWKQGLLFKKRRSLGGWVLQTTNGLLGPTDLLSAQRGSNTEPGSVSLEVAGRDIALPDTPAWSSNGVATLDVTVGETMWPASRIRMPSEPEDCIAVADPAGPPFPLAAARLTPTDGPAWIADPAISLDESWHGACVLSRRDGLLVGVLIIEDELVRVSLLKAP